MPIGKWLMRISLAWLSLLVAPIPLIHGMAHGSIINGGFETGNLLGWETIGDVSVQTSSFGTPPAGGAYQALIAATTPEGWFQHYSSTSISGTDVVSIGDIKAWGAPYEGIGNGSAIKQTISVSRPAVIHFEWNYLTDEMRSGEPYPDGGYVFVNASSEELTNNYDLWLAPGAIWTLDGEIFPNITNGVNNYPFRGYGSIGYVSHPFLRYSSTPFYDETGYNHSTILLQSPGTYTIGFAAINSDDGICDSALLVDNIKVVPEPSLILLLGSGVAGLLGYRWRRPKK